MATAAPARNDQRTIFGWAMYDWANSAYITAGSLVFAIYFGETIFPEAGFSVFGRAIGAEAFFGILVGIGAFVLFLAMPILGAVADYSNSKKRLLQVFAYTSSLRSSPRSGSCRRTSCTRGSSPS
jgi:UMF1 family MFS transporter